MEVVIRTTLVVVVEVVFTAEVVMVEKVVSATVNEVVPVALCVAVDFWLRVTVLVVNYFLDRTCGVVEASLPQATPRGTAPIWTHLRKKIGHVTSQAR
jgi:hypothetical protein